MRPFTRVVAALACFAASSCLADIPDLVVGGSAATAGGGPTGGAAAGFCASLPGSPLVCEDFDGSASLPVAPWKVTTLHPSRAHVELAEDEVQSAPRSLRAWVDPPDEVGGAGGDGGGGGPPLSETCIYSTLTYEFDDDQPALEIALDVRSTVPGIVVGLNWRTEGISCYVLFRNEADQIVVLLQGIPDPDNTEAMRQDASMTFPGIGPELPSWRHLELTVDKRGALPEIKVGDADELLGEDLGPWFGLCREGVTDFEVQLGAHCVGLADNVTDSHFDNVVLSAL